MQLKPFSFKQFLLKVSLFLAIFYAFIISTSFLITAYLFLSLDSYKSRIEGVVFKHTGYTLNIGNISSSISKSLLPQITINNAKLTNPTDPKQSFTVKQLQFVFSYSSIWNLEPIFDQINIDGTNLNFEYLKNGNILFNGINLNNPDKKAVANTKKSPIDIELWLLKQKQIKLSHINFNFEDKKNNLPQLQLYNVTAILHSGFRHTHTFTVDIGRSKEDQRQILSAILNWHGGKVTEFYNWKDAELRVQSYREGDPLAGNLSQYIPGVSVLEKFNADTAIDAKIKNGKLQFFYANFDIQNLRYIMSHHKNLINFPQLGGIIKITLADDNHYTLQATNLNISTPDGYLFDNKNIFGNYIVGQKGDLNINDTNIKSFNNLLQMFPATNKFSISGSLDIVKFSWLGKIIHPDSYNVLINFRDLALLSKESDVPSIDHVSGSASINKDDGYIDLSLKKSTLNYPKMFLIPYRFNSLTTRINWQFHKDKTFEVVLGNTQIHTIDFNGTAQGKYTYTPGTNGYLDLTAHIDRLLTSKVGDYLPIIIGMPVHKWLNNGLIGGYGTNAKLTLKGWLANFPFNDGNGMFYIDADIDHGKLNYVDTWPTLDNIVGKFQIRNQKIIIMADGGQVSGNNIDKALVIIPDMTSSTAPAYLTADGEASGSTPKFMDYLSKTPINEIIGKLPEKVTTSGNGKVKIHLMVPFADPKHTKVDGNYTFINNTVQFDLPVPFLSDINGVLFFSEHGVKIDQLNATALNSQANLTATTAPNGAMHFTVNTLNLDMKLATDFYSSFMSPIVSGTCPATITFDTNKQGISQIQVKSNLHGVKLDTPAPLGKESSTSSMIAITVTPSHGAGDTQIDLAYANTLYGKILLEGHGKLDHGAISIGTDVLPESTANNPKIMVYMNTPTFSLDGWSKTIIKVIKNITHKNTAREHSFSAGSIESNLSSAPTHKPNAPDIFPAEVIIDTPSFKLYNGDYQHSNIDVLILKDRTLFNMNNTLTDGFGSYVYSDKTLDLEINKFNALLALDSVKESKKANAIIQPTKSGLDFVKLNGLDARTDSNITKFNESAYTLRLTRENIKSFVESTSDQAINFPTLKLRINDLYYENVRLASAAVQLRPSGMDLLVESGDVQGNITHTTFHGGNYCMECGLDKAFVELLLHMQINDVGQMLNNFGLVGFLAKGSGTIDTSLQWNGKFQDFKLEHTIAVIKIDIQNGKFLKVSSGGIFGEIMGLINLQAITNFAHLDFSDAFSNGFYFNILKVRAYLLNNILTVKSLYMSGPLAIVQSYGTIDLNNELVDSYLIITPKLGAGIAVASGVATLNPLVAIIVYAGEWALGEPFNKLFAFSYHITGPLKKPKLTKVQVSQQVVNNLNSAIGVSNGAK